MGRGILLLGVLYALGCNGTDKLSPVETASATTPDTGTPFRDTGTGGDSSEPEPECGDGTVDPGEDCDDAGESTTCDTDCTLAECGDGLLNTTAGEGCDDAGESTTCDTDCTLAECGDGLLNTTAGENCDDAGESTTCDTDCSTAECGDGLLNTTAGEGCDDAGESTTCDTDCTPAECGDGWMNATAGEDCDDAGDSIACDADCTIAECGDGWTNTTAGEACDDEGESEACDTDCTPTECGDGLINTTASESCDDAGESEVCDIDCTPAECGDGWINVSAGEVCDGAGETADCDTDCTPAECGDGWMNTTAGEACDDAGDSVACDEDCTPAECGDGWTNLAAGEVCDDAGESIVCDEDCTPAECGDGWMNTTAGEACDDAGPSVDCDDDCTPAECGDGTLNLLAGESCDAGGESEDCDTDCTLAECGDGWMNTVAGEECDDAGPSSACDEDCTVATCGDGTVNPWAGEECEGTDTDCLDDCTFRVGMCHTETPWNLIAESLYEHDEAGLLPTLPEDFIDGDWSTPLPEFIWHSIFPTERFPDDEVAFDDCRPPAFWDSERIQLGGFVTPEGGSEDPYCRVQSDPDEPDDNSLLFFNRARLLNGSPITGEPTWVRMRFPVPDGHTATSLTYWIDSPRVFGSHPTECTGTDIDESGECARTALGETETWDEEIPPGIFLLWGRATDCEGWEITGPHDPAGIMTWGGPADYTVDVPESLREVDELVVSLLVYRQYPGGCYGPTCKEGRQGHANLHFNGARLVTQSPFTPTDEPSTAHPRLFGENEAWVSRLAEFDGLACSGEPDWSDGSTWGGLPNVRNIWDDLTKGGKECLGEVPDSIDDIDDAADYLDGSAADRFDQTRAVRILHLIRRERACSTTDLIECHHDPEEIDALAAAIIDVEMTRLEESDGLCGKDTDSSDVDWCTFGFPFDLRTREPMRQYTLLADVLWDDLTEEQHALILEVTGEQIDGFLNHFEDVHWAIFNGNNWTPVLAEAAMYWGITYYYEDERAPEVVWRALQSMWLHRDQYLDDGVYAEGLLMYSQVSFDPLMAVSQLTEASFGDRLDSVPWERMDGFSQWALEFMAPDGSTIDFGDAWAKRGWGTFMPVLASMADPGTLGLDLSPDPCFAHKFFSNKYYYHGMTDPWRVHPALAKDWPSVLTACADIEGMLPDGVEVDAWTSGGWGSVRIGMPGMTEIAASVESDAPSRFRQADQVMLAISAIPNSASHTEMDFGTVVWVPYGSRILADFGYGTLHARRYETAPEYPPDQNPTGHSTLVIPEALLDGDPSTNTSQIDGRDGTIEVVEIDGHETLLLDGSTVYGRDDPELGWLEHFHRRVVPLASGHIVMIDDFYVRDDRPEASVSEYWYTHPWDPGFDAADCLHQYKWVDRSVGETTLDLLPACSGLENTASESAGRIEGIGLNAGKFVDDGEISLINRLDDIVTRSRLVWEPNDPVRRDLRLFALVAETSESLLPVAEWSWVDCEDDLCAQLNIDGSPAIELGFTDNGTTYSLVSLSSE